ncbi:MAG: hypothetical protein ACRD3O_17315, partial [Terriglobia bacterium]
MDGAQFSWLAQMLPGTLANQAPQAGAGLSQASLQAGQANLLAQTGAPQHGSAAQQSGGSTGDSGAPQTVSRGATHDAQLQTKEIEGQGGPDAGTASTQPLTPGAGDSPSPDRLGEATPTQAGFDLNEAVASLERAGFPVLSASTAPTANAISGAFQKAETPAVKVSPRPISSSTDPAKDAPSKAPNTDDSQATGKDAASASNAAQPGAAPPESHSAAKSPSSSSGDNS